MNPLCRDSWQRIELKYAVSEQTARAALRFALPFVEPDSAAGPCGTERVTSLYLDTPRAGFLHSHLACQVDRFKLRVRHYGERPGPLVYFEVKRKVGHVIDKTRTAVPTEATLDILSRRRLRSAALGTTPHEHLQHFVWLMNLHDARPRLIVTCAREAYVCGLAGCEARITLDRQMAFQRVRQATLTADPSRLRLTPTRGGSVVLELKYSGFPPSFLRELALRLSPFKVAYSKYVAGMGAATEGLGVSA